MHFKSGTTERIREHASCASSPAPHEAARARSPDGSSQRATASCSTTKSLVGFLIQLPVFLAAFDMLAEDFDLHRVSFLWIRDLSRPDMLLRFPFCIPFFGCDVNALPFLI